MNVALITSKERFDRYCDSAWIPEGTQLAFFGAHDPDDVIVRSAPDTEVILADAVLPVSASLINALPRLRMIHSEGVGYNCIDVEAASAKGVYVCNNRGVNAGQVAEQTILLLLALLRRFSEGETLVRAGRQAEAKSRFIMDGMRDLGGMKIGLIGFGAIAKALCLRLRPFGCELFYYSRHRSSPEEELQFGACFLEREELLRTCDVISLHVPVTPETQGMICAETLEKMKRGAILLNTSRGALVCSADAAEAIRSGRLSGFGADTLDPEPVPADDPLLLLPEPYRWRVALSPHIAGTTAGVFAACYRNFWQSVALLQKGEKPNHIVNVFPD